MPELPEVESAARRLRAAAVGRTVHAVRVLHAAVARTLPSDDVARIVGRRVDAVERRGKHQWLVLDDGARLHAHFRMSGDWAILAAGDALPAHARAALDLDDATTIALVDPRALGGLAYVAPGVAVGGALGPDATDAAFDAAWLRAALRGRKVAIKPALLDQRVVAGVGNIYAAEALWRAALDPRVPAGALGPARAARLVDAVGAVLADALDDPGRYQDGEAVARLAVYGREGEACRRCGRPVRRLVQGGRSTYFCPGCQRR